MVSICSTKSLFAYYFMNTYFNIDFVRNNFSLVKNNLKCIHRTYLFIITHRAQYRFNRNYHVYSLTKTNTYTFKLIVIHVGEMLFKFIF